MTKNIFIKLLICSMFAIILSSSFCVPSSYALGDIFSSGKDFLAAGESIDDTINTTALQETSDYIYNTLLAIAVMVAIIVAMILGIQFMAASADEKAKVKEAMLPFVVGCIVVFGAFTIWKVAVNIGNKAEGSSVARAHYTTEDLVAEIENGELDVKELSDKELRILYSYYELPRTKGELLRDCNWDVEQAEEEFLALEKSTYVHTRYKVKVYKECKLRGMVDENGISLIY